MQKLQQMLLLLLLMTMITRACRGRGQDSSWSWQVWSLGFKVWGFRVIVLRFLWSGLRRQQWCWVRHDKECVPVRVLRIELRWWCLVKSWFLL